MFIVEREVPSPEVFLMIREAAGMGPRSMEGATKGLGNELCSVVLKLEQNKKIVGMGRIVGDGGTVFHICDMAVIPDFQRQGGGTMVMNELMRYIEEEAPPNTYINLLADVNGFYERWGFKPSRPSSTGMHLKRDSK